jgi:hypothetical protein
MWMILVCGMNFGSAQGIQGRVNLTGKTTVISSGHAVTLSWTASTGASTYCIYRATVQGGPYQEIATGVVGTNFIDPHVTHKQTFYYVTTAVNGGGESVYSNETVAVIP